MLSIQETTELMTMTVRVIVKDKIIFGGGT